MTTSPERHLIKKYANRKLYDTRTSRYITLDGIAAYALVRELTGSRAGAFVGGLAFAFAPFVGEHVTHIQMLMAFGMPVAPRQRQPPHFRVRVE